MGPAQCNGKYYWGFHKVTYQSNGWSSSVKARAWDYQYSELCVEDTSGWKGVRTDFTPTITCDGETTQARV